MCVCVCVCVCVSGELGAKEGEEQAEKDKSEDADGVHAGSKARREGQTVRERQPHRQDAACDSLNPPPPLSHRHTRRAVQVRRSRAIGVTRTCDREEGLGFRVGLGLSDRSDPQVRQRGGAAGGG